MNAPIRFGIASFAHYHANFWAQAINDSPHATLAGIWDDDRTRGADAAKRYGTRFFADVGSLLRECDAVGLTSETARHAALAEEAARAGVHILCEKPTAASLDDCDRIERAVRRAGVTFMQNFPKRFDPVHRELVEIARHGELGEIRLVRIRHGHYYGLDPEFAQQWYADPTLAGGGALLDEGVHATDLLRWLIGEPTGVWATIRPATFGRGVEDGGLAVFSFASGAAAEVASSWTFVAAEQSVEVFGTEGTAVLSGVDLASKEFVAGPHLRTFRRGDERGTWRASSTVPYIRQGVSHFQGPWHFIDCLRHGSPPLLGLDDGRRALAMVLAAYRAAASGRTEPIP